MLDNYIVTLLSLVITIITHNNSIAFLVGGTEGLGASSTNTCEESDH